MGCKNSLKESSTITALDVTPYHHAQVRVTIKRNLLRVKDSAVLESATVALDGEANRLIAAIEFPLDLAHGGAADAAVAHGNDLFEV